MFVCFGSQVRHGEETFVKVDKTYPLMCADIANNNKIHHYFLYLPSDKMQTPCFFFSGLKDKL